MEGDVVGDTPGAGQTTAPIQVGESGHTSGLARSSAVVGAGTLLSRLTGLLRTVVTAGVLGAAALANSYNLANTTPNIIYDLVLGGILAATLVPVFVDLHATDDRDGEMSVVTVATVVLAIVTVLVVIAAPAIFAFYTALTPGEEAAGVSEVGVPLLRLFAPQVLCYGLIALFGAQLNTRRRFAAAAFAPVANNLLVIVVMLAFGRLVGSELDPASMTANPGRIWLLGVGTTLGIVAQAVVLVPALRRAKVPMRWRFDVRAAAVSRVARLSGWTMGYVVNNVIALMIILALATRVGGVSAYTYAYVFFQLPYGLFAVSIMTASSPRLAACVRVHDLAGFRTVFGSGLRGLVLTILPASVGLALIARPLIGALLQFRNFTAEDASVTADALIAFSVGLLGYALYLFALRGFYAFTDTRTPFLCNVVQNVLNVGLAIAFLDRWGTAGLALAFGLSYILASLVAFTALARTAHGLDLHRIVPMAWRVAMATGLMAIVVVAVARLVGSDAGLGAWLRTGSAAVAGVVMFGAAALVLGVPEVRQGLERARARAPKRP